MARLVPLVEKTPETFVRPLSVSPSLPRGDLVRRRLCAGQEESSLKNPPRLVP